MQEMIIRFEAQLTLRNSPVTKVVELREFEVAWSDATGDFVGCYEYADCVAPQPVVAPTPPPTQPTAAYDDRFEGDDVQSYLC